MAKKSKNQTVILENVELKPQVIGMTYQKKSNLPRIIFIFIALIAVVYFIDDISVFVNNLLGRKTAETIQNRADENNEKRNNNGNNSIMCRNNNETVEYRFTNNELYEIKYTKVDGNKNDANYNERYAEIENKKNEYDNINGVNTTINNTEEGYIVSISIDLQNLSNALNETYFFNYKDNKENVRNKMESNGFNCN